MKEINPQNLAELNLLLEGSNLYQSPIVSCKKIEHGNMNLTLRATDEKGNSLIIKQGRGYVEKYPSIEAPIGRTSIEANYYELLKGNRFLEGMSPNLISVCHKNQVLLMDDLGDGRDGIEFYSGKLKLLPEHIDASIGYLKELHSVRKECDRPMNNLSMLELNSFHMFDFPFSEDGHAYLAENVDIALSEMAKELVKEQKVAETAKFLKEKYLKGGEILTHGDFYFGSLLMVADRVYVIDPEFCFWGYKEFDLGILIAHDIMLSRSENTYFSAFDDYLRFHEDVDLELVRKQAAMEILRRLFGVAQLPFQGELSTLDRKKKLVKTALSYLD